MFQSGCHGREYGNQGNGSEHGPCLRPTMDNSRGALRARTARLQIPGCCTVSVRSQLGRTLLPAYGKFHRSEEHTSELQSLMRSSYAVFCLKNKNNILSSHL